MESIAFEEFGIDKCRNENCNQLYNADSIKLAVWLYGVIFLHEEKQFECADPVFGPSENEKKIMDEKTNGYAGITCPKCLKTNFYKMKAREIKKFKKFLNSWSMLKKSDPDDKGQSLTWMPELISVNLRYYSPFGERSAALKDFCIHEYAYDKPIDTLEFSDDFITTILGEPKDLQGSFCSYDISDNIEPAGTYTGIYWFDEKSIAEITNDENEKKKRLFPRYHYFHDLMEKIDALLTYNYYYGRQIGQVLIDTEESMKKDLKNYEFHYLKKEDIDKRKKQIEIDFEKSGKFFGILISDPIEFNLFIREPLKNCDYFWITGDPFSGKGMPEDFSFGSYSDEDTEFSTGVRNNHKKMVELIQENFHKQYVQEFLKDNLIDFLEEYEGLLQSSTFSYAAVWELKESYLKGLFKATQIGLRSELPYAMYREGEGWKIVFDGKSFGGLRGKGFLWMYLTLFHQPSPVYYTSLHDTYEAKSAQGTGDQVAYGNNPDENFQSRGHKDFEQETYEKKTTEYMEKTEQLTETRSGVLTKQYYADPTTIKKFKEELEEKELAIEQAQSVGNIELLEERMDALTEFLEFYEKKIGIRKVKTGKGKRDYKIISSKFKDERYQKINGKIKKNYRDALSVLKDIKEAEKLHAHFLKYFRSEDGAFIYEAPAGIDWHLD